MYISRVRGLSVALDQMCKQRKATGGHNVNYLHLQNVVLVQATDLNMKP